MYLAVIDIGTNTVRTVVYDNKKIVENIRFGSSVLENTQNGILTDSGTAELCRTLLLTAEQLKKYENIQIFCLATYALRCVRNFSAVHDEAFQKTGIDIRLLSGAEEAECDFLAVKGSGIPLADVNAAFDLGGGSCQLLVFDKNGVIAEKSMPIGTKKLAHEFVSDLLPTPEGKQRIAQYVRCAISDFAPYFSPTLYAMGGTAKNINKICTALRGSDADFFTAADLAMLQKAADTDTELYCRLAADRATTLIPGALVINELVKCFSADKIVPLACGVRDGFLAKIRTNGSRP